MSDPTRVLVIDDDQVICEMLERALGKSGFSVTTTTTTIGAGYSFLKHEPHIVVLDVRLAGSLPIEDFCGRLFKAHEKVQVILYSASDHEELQEMAERCQVQAFIPKTDGIDSLMWVIRHLVQTPRPPGGEPLDGSHEAKQAKEGKSRR